MPRPALSRKQNRYGTAGRRIPLQWDHLQPKEEGVGFMFMFTVTRPGLRQAGALALCAACLCGTIAAAVHFTGEGAAVTAAANVAGVETTQDIATYFTGYGFEVDLATASVDKVKIPRRWDDSFAAFNQVVEESGLTLADHKGKTVEKWTVLCPARSDGEKDCYCVLLVYKGKAIGAYLLEKPGGEVTGLVSAAQQAAQTAAGAGEDPADPAAAPGEDPAAQAAADAFSEDVFPTD